MAQPQSFQSHSRWDPIVHFVIVPLLALNLGFSIYATIHRWDDVRPYHHTHLWWIVMSIVLILIVGTARGAALRAQNRVIRLEEQLRLADLLDEAHLGLIDKITMQQFIALRFASDAEVAALAARAVAENLDPKQIKQAIVNWRPDNDRV
jgi:hypothetical protein